MNKELLQLLLDVATHLEDDDDTRQHTSEELLDRLQAALNGEIVVNGCKTCALWEREHHAQEEKLNNLTELLNETNEKNEQGATEYDKLQKLLKDDRKQESKLLKIEREVRDAGWGSRQATLDRISHILNDREVYYDTYY